MTTTQNPKEQPRMKAMEHLYRTRLPENSFAVIRVDGKGFSKYTRSLVRPFDAKFTHDMRETALYMTQNIDGAVFGYTQSDEISIIISDLHSDKTQAWFGGQVQKIVSIAAALATAKFNQLRPEMDGLALFDARVHHLEGTEDVLEYLQWRQKDAIKNSVGMLASAHFSHKSLMSVSVRDRKEMLLEKGIDWKDLDAAVKFGSIVERQQKEKEVTFFHKGEQRDITMNVVRNEWTVEAAPFIDGLEVIKLG